MPLFNRALVSLCLLLATQLSGCGQSPDGQANPTIDDNAWPVFDAPPSGRANQAVIIDGEWVGSDEIHFARGANADDLAHEEYYCTNPSDCPPTPAPTPVEDDEVYRHATWGAFGADRAAHNGDYLLPTDTTLWPDFTADIAFTRFEADSRNLYLQLRFASFPSPTAQIATVTFTTHNSVTALRDWPNNAGVKSDYSHALTLHGNGADWVDDANNSNSLISLGGATRLSDHAFEARIPLTAMPPTPWRISIGSGLADPSNPTHYWTVPAGAPTASSPGTDSANAPGSNVWDLAFTPHDPNYHDDHIQAEILLSGDVSAASVVLNPADLQAKITTTAPVITGRIAHSYQSAFDFGDGIVRGSPGTPPVTSGPMAAATPPTVKPRDLAVNYEYTGGVQPYFAYIPNGYASSSEEWPLLLYFHGLNNYIWEPFGLTLGLEAELEKRGYLFASLLGRGDISFEGRGELDPLEVIEHMAERYRIDRSRIYLLGHSHGAGGVMNVARRNPDKFAGVVAAQILDGPSQPENLMHVPTLHIAGLQDPIDNGNGALSRYNALSDLGFDTQAIIYTAKTHENSSIYDSISQIFDLFDRNQTPKNPAVVRYTRAADDFDESLGLLHNSAYWVSNMQAADPSADMSVNAETFGITHQTLDPDNANRTQNNAFDSGGESGRSLGVHYQTTPAFGASAPLSNTATLQTSNLIALELDVMRMAINLRANDAALQLNLSHTLDLTLTHVGGGNLPWQAQDNTGSILASGISVEQNQQHRIVLPANTEILRFR